MDAAVAEEWDEGKVEDEWEDRLPQDQAEIVYVRTAAQQLLILSVSPVIKETVQSVEQE